MINKDIISRGDLSKRSIDSTIKNFRSVATCNTTVYSQITFRAFFEHEVNIRKFKACKIVLATAGLVSITHFNKRL